MSPKPSRVRTEFGRNRSEFADLGTNRSFIDVKPEGYGVDRRFPSLIYVREDARADINKQRISWIRDDVEQSIPLLPGRVYIAPSGYRLRMEKHPTTPTWRLIGSRWPNRVRSLGGMDGRSLHDRLSTAVGKRTYRSLSDLTGVHPETVRRYMQGQAPSVEFVSAVGAGGPRKSARLREN